MLLADTLSRPCLPESSQGYSEPELETVNTVNYLPITDGKLQKVTEMIQTGRPQNKKDILTDTQHCHSFQDKMSFQDVIVLRGERERAVITDVLRAHS